MFKQRAGDRLKIVRYLHPICGAAVNEIGSDPVKNPKAAPREGKVDPRPKGAGGSALFLFATARFVVHFDCAQRVNAVHFLIIQEI